MALPEEEEDIVTVATVLSCKFSTSLRTETSSVYYSTWNLWVFGASTYKSYISGPRERSQYLHESHADFFPSTISKPVPVVLWRMNAEDSVVKSAMSYNNVF